MAKSSKQAYNSATAVVTNLKPAQGAIRPPDGWALNSQHGILRFDASTSGRLVRLADLVQWLMDTRELPCGVALELVCTELEAGRAGGCMYMLKAGGYAIALGPEDCFAVELLFSRSFWEGEPIPKNEDCGLAGAIKHMRSFWSTASAPSASEYLFCEALDPLAIRLDKAFELWGYGRVDVGAAKDAPGAVAWSGERLAKELAALKLQGKAEGFKNHTQRLAKKADLSEREVTRRTKEWRDSQSNGKVVSTLFAMGRSTTPKASENTKN